jgi:hypothetical protein
VRPYCMSCMPRLSCGMNLSISCCSLRKNWAVSNLPSAVLVSSGSSGRFRRLMLDCSWFSGLELTTMWSCVGRGGGFYWDEGCC